jgi:tRNA(fMet)-specific endonuclease VapC
VTYLINTDRTIDFIKGRDDAIRLLTTLATEPLSISLITYGEIYDGIYRSMNPVKQESVFLRLLGWIEVLGFDEAIMKRFARIRGDLRVIGQSVGDADILIAATAIHHDQTLVTRNQKHFQRIPGLKLVREL